MSETRSYCSSSTDASRLFVMKLAYEGMLDTLFGFSEGIEELSWDRLLRIEDP